MNLARLRKRRGLTQTQFWNRIGLSQAAGSRLENKEREIQEPVRILITIAYGEQDDCDEMIYRIRNGR